MNSWAVYRMDFTGNEFLVEKGLTEVQARNLAKEYESHKHHQHYWVDNQPEEVVDFAAKANEMIQSGGVDSSSLEDIKGISTRNSHRDRKMHDDGPDSNRAVGGTGLFLTH